MFIVIANPKGGVGKSTLATNLAVMFSIRKNTVTLFDADRQRSSHKWCLLRDNIGVQPHVYYRDGLGDIQTALQDARNESDVVIVDLGGKRSAESAYALAEADELIIPMTCGQFETWALNDMTGMLDGLREAGAGFKARALLNNAPYHKNSIKVRRARNDLNNYVQYFGTCESMIIGRDLYGDALTRGLAATELDSDGKATQNLNEVFEELFL